MGESEGAWEEVSGVGEGSWEEGREGGRCPQCIELF